MDRPAAAPPETAGLPPAGWVLVVCREDALVARRVGAVQASALGEHRLRRLGVGDGVVLYSPREQNRAGAKVQRFTAVGVVTGAAPYQRDDDPHRSWFLDVDFDQPGPAARVPDGDPATDEGPPPGEAAVRPLLGPLSFVRDAKGWGVVFRPGFLPISPDDFALVRAAAHARRGEPEPPGRG